MKSLLTPLVEAFIDDLCEEDPHTAQQIAGAEFGMLMRWIQDVRPDERCGCLIGTTLLAYDAKTAVPDDTVEVVLSLIGHITKHRWTRVIAASGQA